MFYFNFQMNHDQAALQLLEDLRAEDKKYFRACTQIATINRRLRALSIRYRRIQSDRRSFKSMYLAKILTLKGLSGMFRHYCQEKIDVCEQMEAELKYMYGIDYTDYIE